MAQKCPEFIERTLHTEWVHTMVCTYEWQESGHDSANRAFQACVARQLQAQGSQAKTLFPKPAVSLILAAASVQGHVTLSSGNQIKSDSNVQVSRRSGQLSSNNRPNHCRRTAVFHPNLLRNLYVSRVCHRIGRSSNPADRTSRPSEDAKDLQPYASMACVELCLLPM